MSHGSPHPQYLPCGQEDQIPDEAVLLRSARHHLDDLRWDADREVWLPTDRALKFDEACSAHWKDHLEDVHDEAVSSVSSEHRPLVFGGSVQHFRGLEFGVAHSPEGEHPIDCAHSSINWPNNTESDKPTKRRLRTGMRRGLELIGGEVTFPPPPEA